MGNKNGKFQTLFGNTEEHVYSKSLCKSEWL